MRNTFSGPCYRCGLTVPVGEGHAERATPERLARLKMPAGPRSWLTQHASCAIQWRGTFHSIHNDEPQKHFD